VTEADVVVGPNAKPLVLVVAVVELGEVAPNENPPVEVLPPAGLVLPKEKFC